MNQPTVSLAIAVYNAKEDLRLLLKSIERQTVKPLEVLIEDDGSSDGTKELVNEMKSHFSFPLVHFWQEDIGFRKSAIINKALSKSKGEYIVHIDGDVVLDKHFIEDHLYVARENYLTTGSRGQISEKLRDKMIQNGSVNLSPLACGVNRKQNVIRCKCLMKLFLDSYKKDVPYFARGCNMAFWKEDFIRVNGFNEDLLHIGTEDFEFVARLNSIGVKRQFIKFGAIQYHMYHKKRATQEYPENLKILNDAIKNKTTWCDNGVDKYF